MAFRAAAFLLVAAVGVVFLLGLAAALQYPRGASVPQAGVGPASPWYPFELLGERVILFLFSRQPREQARLAAYFAEERLRELEELVRRSAAPRLVRRAQQRAVEASRRAWEALAGLPAVQRQMQITQEVIGRLRRQIAATRERVKKAGKAVAAARDWVAQTRELERSLRALLPGGEETAKD